MHGCIVVGTDGSDTADRAVTAAIELARCFAQSVHIVSAYRPTVSGTYRVEAILANAESRCRVAGVESIMHPVVGDPAGAILDVAEKLDAALIVVGNRHIGSKSRFLLGNVPSKVVHHAPCSTQIVHTV